MPLISICIPNYNYEKFISQTIESVLNQSFQDYEILISDNASTDGSLDMIKSFKDERINLNVNKENICLYQNINGLVKNAKGELSCILHSDDYYKPDFLRKIADSYKQNPNCNVFVTGAINFHNNSGHTTTTIPCDEERVYQKQEILDKLYLSNFIGNGVNVAIKTDTFNKIGGFRDKYRYSADCDLWFRLAQENDFYLIPDLLAYYRIHDNNLTHKALKNLDMLIEGLEIHKEFCSHLSVTNEQKYKKYKYYLDYSLDKLNKYNSIEMFEKILKKIAEYHPNIQSYRPYYLSMTSLEKLKIKNKFYYKALTKI